jgi:ubiquinol-cytochrome c reductase iron-sulfur subunit
VKHVERFVAACFIVSILAALGLAVVYVRGGQTELEGILLGLALAGVGGGLMAWAIRLMPRIQDETQPREHGPLPHEELDSVADQVESGVEEIRRRSFLSKLLLGAAAALGLAALFPIRSLGKAPGSNLDTTEWTAGAKLVDANGEFVRADTLEVGSFITVFPEGFVGSGDSQAVLIRVEPDKLQLPPGQAAGAPEGLVVYSKICTHAGCPLGLYLATTHELRCPCHQSTFDVLNGAQPVYGPAPKPLPQLPIQVDGDGVLSATGDFDAPVGPSYWNMPRGASTA